MGFSKRARNTYPPLLFSWALTVLWACFIFMASAHTGQDLNQGNDVLSHVKRWMEEVSASIFGPGLDIVSTIGHFTEYVVLGALLRFSLGTTHAFLRARAIVGEHHGKTDALDEDAAKTRARIDAASARMRMVLLVGAVALASLYGVTDELHQLFVPGRMCDPADWLTDTLGATLGACIVHALMKKR